VLNSREDALHALELAAAYFRTNEPSSPLPLLIDRAKRLAPLPFLEILRDLAPDGLAQAQTVAGTTDEQEPR
jgi:type VI secretion system protein ImpA